ncbi:MAG: nickel-dependent lactate racemase [Bradymonadia bacterium]|jgi:nickel-dependent lactate racemase
MARPRPRITRDSNIEFVDDKTGPLVAFHGTRFKELTLPRGSRIIYPNRPMEPIGNVKAAIRYALSHPDDSDPLFAKLRPGMKLTIAIDDLSMPLPPMAKPDIRGMVLTEVLKLCADYGVDDIHLIIAVCLHRHMTGPEMKRMVGDKIYRDYYPDRLYNHDAEDPDGIVEIGVTKEGDRVRLNRRAVESDLLIYVNLNLVPMNGGHKSVTVGLCDYASVSAHHNTRTLHKCHSYMDTRHEKSALQGIMDRMGKIVDEQLDVFHIETTVNNRMFGGQLAHLGRPERTWSEFDWAKQRASAAMLERLPESARRAIFNKVTAPYGVIGVEAGATEPVHAKILEKQYAQYAVPVKGQADVVVMGVSPISPYSVYSIMNPLLVQVMVLGYLFNLYRNMPLVKKDGVLIVFHPCREEFHRTHHPSYVEFYHRMLSISTNSYDIHKFEHEFTSNPDYIQMYRKGNAYHPVHPFYMWYWGDAGRKWLGDHVIVVDAEHTQVPLQLGWRNARTLDEALEMAQGILGKSVPEVTMFHCPPIMLCDMEE